MRVATETPFSDPVRPSKGSDRLQMQIQAALFPVAIPRDVDPSSIWMSTMFCACDISLTSNAESERTQLASSSEQADDPTQPDRYAASSYSTRGRDLVLRNQKNPHPCPD